MAGERHSRSAPGVIGGFGPWRAHVKRLVFVVSVAALATACSQGGTDNADQPHDDKSTTTRLVTTTISATGATSSTIVETPTSPTSTASAGDDEREQIVARYIGFWDARLAANTGTPNPDDPGLSEFAAGAQLVQVKAETQSNLTDGLALRQAERPKSLQRVTVVELGADHAVVQECVVDDAVVVRRDSGEVVNDAVTTQNVRGELDRIDGEWRVTKAQLIQQWDGVAGCASE